MAAPGQNCGARARDHYPADLANDQDNPYERYVRTWEFRRKAPTEALRTFKNSPEPLPPVPCRLCDKNFLCREEFIAHVEAEHGGLQRYRNAFFALASLLPHVVRGQEWRMIVANFSEFISRAAKDWECFTPAMTQASRSEDGLSPPDRWEPRHRAACCDRVHSFTYTTHNSDCGKEIPH